MSDQDRGAVDARTSGWRRVPVVPVGVSLTLVAAATVDPLSAVMVVAVPAGALVALHLSRGVWRSICTRLCLVILLLAIGAAAASDVAPRYGAIRACLPAALAALLYAARSVLPDALEPWRRSVLLAAGASAGLAALLTLAQGLQAFFSPLSGANGAEAAVAYAALVGGAPALIMLVRYAVPLTGSSARVAQTSAAAAFAGGVFAALLFGGSPGPHLGSALCAIAANAAAFILLAWCMVQGERVAFAVERLVA